MSAFFDRVNSDLAASIGALGETFTFGGANYACGITRPSKGNAPMEGGSWDEYAGMIVCRLDTLASVPEEGDTITVDGKACFVGKVKSNTGNPVVTIMFSNHPLPQ